MESPQDTTDPVVSSYRSLGTTYDLEIIFPDGTCAQDRFEFGPSGPHVFHRIAASALLDWAMFTKSFFFVRCWSRRTQLSYRPERNDGELGIAQVPVPDLLMHYVINVAPGSELAAKHILDYQLRQLT